MLLRRISAIVCSIFIFFSLSACQESGAKLSTLIPRAVILAFGDSLTYGTGASLNAGYPHDLQVLTGLPVINAGVPGEETREGLARLGPVLQQVHPQLVILCLGANDLMHQRPEEQIKENLRKMILLIQNSGAQVVLLAVPTLSWNLTVPDLYAELGKELQVPVDTQLIAQLERIPEYKSDYIHFNNRGYQAMAEAILQFLKDHGAFS